MYINNPILPFQHFREMEASNFTDTGVDVTNKFKLRQI